MRMQCLPSEQFGRFLGRSTSHGSRDLDLVTGFTTLLRRANAFVPSEAGAVFLDEGTPIAGASRATNPLTLVTCFGDLPPGLVGRRALAHKGILRRVYQTGRAHILPSDDEGPLPCDGLAALSGHEVSSAICAPLVLDGLAIGAIELLNRVGCACYTLRELTLLEIFAQTISSSIAVAIEVARAREMALRDELTGLYNDRHLHHVLTKLVAEALVTGSEVGVVFIDLDRFKGVNDRFGHLVGSRMLQEVGALVLAGLPEYAIAARYGGDEFVVATAGMHREAVAGVAESLRRAVFEAVFLAEDDPEDPQDYPGLRLTGIIGCSVGVATLQGDVLAGTVGPPPTAEAAKNRLLRIADECMYRAKAGGRNRVVTAWGEGSGSS
jgi:diguanylate cyclase (GGDEF)-like protein